MSEWLKLLNAIKHRPVDSLLTPTQKTVMNEIITLLRYPNYVNLCGPSGSGKTFVAWAVARATGAIHIVLPVALRDQPGQDGLIIDSAPSDEPSIRRILSRCSLLGARSVVYISQLSTEMPMARVTLSLPTPEDVRLMAKSLALLGYHCNVNQLPPSPSLWSVLQASV
jgi:hypothetical protein